MARLYLTQRRVFDRAAASARARGDLGPIERDELAARFIDVRTLELLAKHTFGSARAGRPPGPEGSLTKLAWSQSGQRLANSVADLLHDVDGQSGLEMLTSRSITIAGGTTEMNKNIIAERVLGLPRD